MLMQCRVGMIQDNQSWEDLVPSLGCQEVEKSPIKDEVILFSGWKLCTPQGCCLVPIYVCTLKFVDHSIANKQTHG